MIHNNSPGNWPAVALLFVTIDVMGNPFTVHLSARYLTSMTYGDSPRGLQRDEARPGPCTSKLLKRFDQCNAVTKKLL